MSNPDQTAETPPLLEAPRPLRRALHSGQHHQRRAEHFLHLGDYLAAEAHSATAISAAVLGLLEHLADDDDDG